MRKLLQSRLHSEVNQLERDCVEHKIILPHSYNHPRRQNIASGTTMLNPINDNP